ncbi:MAG: hypothetical protein R3A80_02665 [Bdellovibrionota bacterium]
MKTNLMESIESSAQSTLKSFRVDLKDIGGLLVSKATLVMSFSVILHVFFTTLIFSIIALAYTEYGGSYIREDLLFLHFVSWSLLLFMFSLLMRKSQFI